MTRPGDTWKELAATGAVGLASAHVGWGFVHGGPAATVYDIFLAACLAYVVSSPFAMMVGFMSVLFVRPAELDPSLEVWKLGKATMVGAVAYFGLSRMVARRARPASTPFNLYMIWLTLAVYASAYLGIARGESLVKFQEVFVKIVLLFFLIVNVLDNQERVRRFMVALSVLLTFVGGYTIWMKFSGTALLEGTRAAGVGMHGDPNDTAMALLMAAPFLIAAVLDTRGLQRLGFLVLLAIVVGGILATQSRGGLLGLAVGVFALVRHRVKSRLFTAAVAVAFAAAVLVIGLRGRATVQAGPMDESAQSRIVAWKAGLHMLRARPVLGMGYETFGHAFPSFAEAVPFEKKSMTAHNSYILCVAEVGLVGSVPFFLMVAGSLLIANRASALARSLPPSLDRAVLTGYAGNVAASFTAAFFLSQTWLWFMYILFAQAAAIGCVHAITFEPGRRVLQIFMPRLAERVAAPPRNRSLEGLES